MRRSKDLTGMRFGMLKVIRLHSFPPSMWECVCDCGKVVIVYVNAITTGHRKSCGCLKKRYRKWDPIDIDEKTYGIPTISGVIALIDKDDYDKVKQFSWQIKNRDGYIQSSQKVCGKKILLHRIIMSTPDNLETDHKNGVKTDNRKANLRVCDRPNNMANTNLCRRNKSGFKGVSWEQKKKKWYASIRVNGKTKYLGRYLNILDAANAYKKASLEHHGEFSVFRRI
jgi:hypothetical protein